MNKKSFSFVAAVACVLMMVTVFGPAGAHASEGELRVSPLERPEMDFAGLAVSETEKSAGSLATRALRLDELVERDHNCVLRNIACGATVTGVLDATDCPVDTGIFADFWQFPGVKNSTVTVNASSAQFDTILFLLNPVPEVVAVDDDGGPGTNSRIVFTLGQGGTWTIAVSNLFAGDFGNYTLSLNCGATGGAPSAPSNLSATAISSSEVNLFWDDNSNNETEFQVEIRLPGGTFQNIGSVPADSAGAAISGLQVLTKYDFRVRARNANGNSGYSNVASATTFGGATICVPDATTLCLNKGRFQGRMSFRRPQSTTENAKALDVGLDFSGLFYFGNPDNAEMLLKVIDGCSLNNRFWVFYAATTNVEFDLRVTDTSTGAEEIYSNPLGMPALPIQDTSAFATCP